jgi:hypothetical protein
MNTYITFENLCSATGLSKHRMRYLQQQGFFVQETDSFALLKKPCPNCVYDARWVEVWRESLDYINAGLDELSALAQARADIF